MVGAEYAYYALEKNQENIMKHFLGETDVLPEKFMVVYDLDMFEHESSILIEDKYGEQHLFAYHGEEIVKEVRSTYPTEPVEEFVIDDDLTITIDHRTLLSDYDEDEYAAEEIMYPRGLFNEEYMEDDFDMEIDIDDDMEF